MLCSMQSHGFFSWQSQHHGKPLRDNWDEPSNHKSQSHAIAWPGPSHAFTFKNHKLQFSLILYVYTNDKGLSLNIIILIINFSFSF